MTESSDFGVSKRESHDSSKFYNSKMYQELDVAAVELKPDNPLPAEFTNKIFCRSSDDTGLPDNCVDLMITSPPYNAGKQYDENLSLDQYLELLHRVLKETYRVLVNGGRACLNIANVGRKPYIPLSDYTSRIMRDIGFLQRGEIIWDKGASAGASCSWGSWRSASNPCLRDVHEYIMIFSKGDFKRPKGVSTISSEQFIEYTKSVWKFPTVSAKKIGHPAPFPEELPSRLIQLYSFENDVVLDPFMGSGTSALAARKSNRRYVGFDITPEYVKLAEERLG